MPGNPNKVCAVITEATIESARAAMNQAAQVADLIELRLDYLSDFDFSEPASVDVLLKDKRLPVIITCRSSSEGGRQPVDDEHRIRLLLEAARRGADYCDIEAKHYARASAFQPDLNRLIVSYHNFEETPEDIHAVYDDVTRHPAAVHKIVTRANTIVDSLAIFDLLDRARTEGRQLIGTAMGQAGIVTRVLGPSRGAFLTYGSLGFGKESAAGQLTCEELASQYRIRDLSRNTNITGIIGHPVSHSASPAMHNRAFAELGLDFVYLPLEVRDIDEFLKRMVRPETRVLEWNLRGFSVTIPHKTAMIPLLDEIDETARRVGAVNTVVVREGRLFGYNTDVSGAMEPLARACELKGARCGVIGAGGSARAVIHGLIERGALVTVFARDRGRAKALSDSFGIAVRSIDSLATSGIDIVINTTPVGMHGHSEGESPVPGSALRGPSLAYDLVYNPLETRFLSDARAEGCQIISGIDMLIAQAALQFELWTGEKPPLEAMREAALLRLGSKAR